MMGRIHYLNGQRCDSVGTVTPKPIGKFDVYGSMIFSDDRVYKTDSGYVSADDVKQYAIENYLEDWIEEKFGDPVEAGSLI